MEWMLTLNSTLLLYQPSGSVGFSTGLSSFKFHSVTISTMYKGKMYTVIFALNSTLLLYQPPFIPKLYGLTLL